MHMSGSKAEDWPTIRGIFGDAGCCSPAAGTGQDSQDGCFEDAEVYVAPVDPHDHILRCKGGSLRQAPHFQAQTIQEHLGLGQPSEDTCSPRENLGHNMGVISVHFI